MRLHDKVVSGQWSEADSLEKSKTGHDELLPQGLHTPENYLFTVQDASGCGVGVLWFAIKRKFDKPIAFVFDIDMEPGFQRQGHGLRAFKALEAKVFELGLTGIALHVFGGNHAARALYEKATVGSRLARTLGVTTQPKRLSSAGESDARAVGEVQLILAEQRTVTGLAGRRCGPSDYG